MEIKKIIIDNKELEYVSEMETEEYETNEMPEEFEDTVDLEGILPKEIDLMEDTFPIPIENREEGKA